MKLSICKILSDVNFLVMGKESSVKLFKVKETSLANVKKLSAESNNKHLKKTTWLSLIIEIDFLKRNLKFNYILLITLINNYIHWINSHIY